MLGSGAKIDMVASLFCLQRFEVCDSTLAKCNDSECVLGIVVKIG